MEQWKDIPGFEGLYQASNTGLIRSAPGKVTSNRRYGRRVWKTRILKYKYKTSYGRRDAAVTLWKDGKGRDYLVARLVAMTWVDGYAPGLTVNHKDGNNDNHDCTNLEWLTRGDNIRHAFDTGLMPCKKAVLLETEGQTIGFSSMAEASRFIGRNTKYLSGQIKRGYQIVGADGKHYTVVQE